MTLSNSSTMCTQVQSGPCGVPVCLWVRPRTAWKSEPSWVLGVPPHPSYHLPLSQSQQLGVKKDLGSMWYQSLQWIWSRKESVTQNPQHGADTESQPPAPQLEGQAASTGSWIPLGSTLLVETQEKQGHLLGRATNTSQTQRNGGVGYKLCIIILKQKTSKASGGFHRYCRNRPWGGRSVLRDW